MVWTFQLSVDPENIQQEANQMFSGYGPLLTGAMGGGGFGKKVKTMKRTAIRVMLLALAMGEGAKQQRGKKRGMEPL